METKLAEHEEELGALDEMVQEAETKCETLESEHAAQLAVGRD